MSKDPIRDEDQKNKLAQDISDQSDVIFSHLPPGEVGADEPLFFTLYEGRVIIAMPRGDSYWFEVDHVVRLHVDETGAYVTTFRNGKETRPMGSAN